MLYREVQRDLLNVLAGPAPESVASTYQQELVDLKQDSMRGLTSKETEAMKSQQRQQLAQQSRAMGGSRRMLQGRSKATETARQQLAALAQQTGAIKKVDEADRQFKEDSQKQYTDLVQKISMLDQQSQDDYQKRRADIGINLLQLQELASQKEVKEQVKQLKNN